ncbi:MAG: hypothetical protein M1821_002882 [Bathelium mastoideum]|nr:MAG: hypothetical protein M1821_002882 [Bathelium mastoideum]
MTQDSKESHTLPERRFYFFPEKDLGQTRSARQLGRATTPQHTGKQLQKWMDECNKGHKACQRHGRHQNKRTFVPTRLLDIRSPEAQRVRIIETSQEEAITRLYVTLSHCWGTQHGFEPPCLTTQNKLEFTTVGVSVASLPENFKQAIEVGHLLCVPYIWIDSLCIVQGDDGDFSQEAPLMHQVYRNSYCNIAAADSKDGKGGLFRERLAQDVLPTRYQAYKNLALFGSQPWVVTSKDLWADELLSTHVYSRAWVFQERMLAPRLLHFAKHQVFWDCATVSACETFPLGLPEQLDDIAGTDRRWRSSLQDPSSLRQQLSVGKADYSLEQFWKNAVHYYTSCNLTKGKDKLIALWGVAKLIRDALGENYGAGLWQGNLEEQLAWRVSKCELQDRPQDLRNNPTWSWASINGPIQLQDRLLEKGRCYYVRDHQARPIQFESADQTAIRFQSLSQSWAEEFAAMKRRIEAMSSSQESTEESIAQTHEKWKTTEQNRDKPPKLRHNSIQIQGHVVGVDLGYNSLDAKWVAHFPDVALQDQSSGTLEIFPDVRPTSNQQHSLLVLAATPHGGGGQNRYNGFGITLQAASEKRHYRRTGAFNFQHINADMWRRLQATDSACVATAPSDAYDNVKGLKFWLD